MVEVAVGFRGLVGMVRVRSRGLHYAYDTKTVQNISMTTVVSDMRFLCNTVKHEKGVDCLCSGGQWERWAEWVLKAYVATAINRLTRGQNSPQGVCGSTIWKKIPSIQCPLSSYSYTKPQKHTHMHAH